MRGTRGPSFHNSGVLGSPPWLFVILWQGTGSDPSPAANWCRGVAANGQHTRRRHPI